MFTLLFATGSVTEVKDEEEGLSVVAEDQAWAGGAEVDFAIFESVASFGRLTRRFGPSFIELGRN